MSGGRERVCDTALDDARLAQTILDLRLQRVHESRTRRFAMHRGGRRVVTSLGPRSRTNG
jgi:hypothetical protein